MHSPHFLKISRELNVSEGQVQSVVRLLEEGATVPFIARYRKEARASVTAKIPPERARTTSAQTG